MNSTIASAAGDDGNVTVLVAAVVETANLSPEFAVYVPATSLNTPKPPPPIEPQPSAV